METGTGLAVAPDNAGTEPRIRMLTRETIPCWYELAFKGVNGNAELVLRVHLDYAAEIGGGIPDSDIPIVNRAQKNFAFTNFAGRFGKDIGFEGALKYLGTAKDGFLEYLVPTPLCRKITDTPCSGCNGTGKDEDFDDEPCKFLCENGKNIVYDYREAFAVCASLSIFLPMMEFPEVTTTAPVPQLLTVITGASIGNAGCPISGSYGRELVHYLKSRRSQNICEMEAAMKVVWERMDGKIDRFYKHSFAAHVQGEYGWLTIDCPGDATGLHPSDHYRNEDFGYDFTCHNLDHPIQQLSLLAALGALSYTVRRDRGER